MSIPGSEDDHIIHADKRNTKIYKHLLVALKKFAIFVLYCFEGMVIAAQCTAIF